MERNSFLYKSLLHKTSLCIEFQLGDCALGDSCGFAHGPDELRTRPVLLKTSMCSDWQQGCCDLPARSCKFAHGRKDMLATSDYYKTKVCFAYRNKGSCTASKACRYAHGPSDIRSGCMKAASSTDMHDTLSISTSCSTSTSILETITTADARDTVQELAPVSLFTKLPGPLKLMKVTEGIEGIASAPADRMWLVMI